MMGGAKPSSSGKCKPSARCCVISTFGSTLSLLCMAVLSVSRIVSIKAVMILNVLTRRAIVKTLLLVFTILTWSLLVSVLPVIPSFQSYFTNGLLFQSNPLFTRVYYTNKADVLEKIKQWNINSLTNLSTWMEIRERIAQVFHNDNITDPMLVGLYGSDDFCLFRYFAAHDSPQRFFIIFVLLLNLLGFCATTFCYTLIFWHSFKSSQATGRRD